MTEVETRILDFADRWWHTTPEALERNPVFVNRLRRQRSGRR